MTFEERDVYGCRQSWLDSLFNELFKNSRFLVRLALSDILANFHQVSPEFRSRKETWLTIIFIQNVSKTLLVILVDSEQLLHLILLINAASILLLFDIWNSALSQFVAWQFYFLVHLHSWEELSINELSD